jgi:hypothetical protein
MHPNLARWVAIAALTLVAKPAAAEQPGEPDLLVPGEPRFERSALPSNSVSSYAVEPPAAASPAATSVDEPWSWQFLPDGLIYRSYLAGVKEPRFAATWMHEKDMGWLWDVALGGRVGVLRWGTEGAGRTDGWELDLEGAAFPRLDLEHDMDVAAVDFRAGMPLTFGCGPWQAKFAYYHLSSHLGDEYMIRNPGAVRINYVRDSLVLGASWYPTDALRLYAEAAWAFRTDGGAQPWEFQFGIDLSPTTGKGGRGAPFVALNGLLRQDFDFGGHFVAQTGWQWRGNSGHLLRTGVQYFAGKSDQYEFFNKYEEQIGLGVWYDF